MPSEEAYQAVLAELAKLAEAWRIHREVVNRAIGYLNEEVVGFRTRLDKDDEAREKRQEQIDTALKTITDSQTKILRRQLVRFGVELAIGLAIVAYLYGMSR